MSSANETWILGIRVTDRATEVEQVQSVLSKFGCSVRTRLGLHDLQEGENAPGGIILLELAGDPVEFAKLENELLSIDGVITKKMIL